MDIPTYQAPHCVIFRVAATGKEKEHPTSAGKTGSGTLFGGPSSRHHLHQSATVPFFLVTAAAVEPVPGPQNPNQPTTKTKNHGTLFQPFDTPAALHFISHTLKQ